MLACIVNHNTATVARAIPLSDTFVPAGSPTGFQFTQGPTRMTPLAGAHHIRHSCTHDLPAGIATFWSKIDNPIRSTQHVQIVLNHHDRMTGINQPAQCIQQHADIIKMQPGGGLIEQKQGATRLACPS